MTEDVRWVNAETKTKTCLTVFTKSQVEDILREYPHVGLNLAEPTFKGIPGEDWGDKKKPEGVGLGSTASWLGFFALFVLSLIGGILFNYANPNGIHLFPGLLATEVITSVAPSRAIADQLSEDTLFVDARPSTFFEDAHIAGAINIPLALFDIMYMMELSDVDKKKDIIVYGRTLSSHYDEQVARKLVLRGHDNTTILKGGLSVWKKKGYPVKP